MGGFIFSVVVSHFSSDEVHTEICNAKTEQLISQLTTEAKETYNLDIPSMSNSQDFMEFLNSRNLYNPTYENFVENANQQFENIHEISGCYQDTGFLFQTSLPTTLTGTLVTFGLITGAPLLKYAFHRYAYKIYKNQAEDLEEIKGVASKLSNAKIFCKEK